MKSKQNTSSAVMQQRAEPHDSLDDFPTPMWGTRALIEKVLWPAFDDRQYAFNAHSVWEPACNRGYMARALRHYFARVDASDVHDYGYWPELPGRERGEMQHRVVDFLWPDPMAPHQLKLGVDWIISNPPFRLGEQFIYHATKFARHGAAMLVRTSFLEGIGRYERLFSIDAPSIVAQFVERLPMVKGRVDRKASTATSYAWLIWIKGMPPQPFKWIPPCRAELERDSDYEVAA